MTQSIQNHENLFVNAFISNKQKQRISYLLKSKKGRQKIKALLPHSLEFDSKSIHKIPDNKQTAENIYALLVSKNAPDICYLISEHTSFDGKIMQLEEALNKIVGSGVATIISCIPGELAYYEGEDLKNRLILTHIKASSLS
ncbi:MAG: hypothetical protein WC782_00105 [Methylococcaceae bacterium]|jgi:hypothetical protein